MIGNFIIDVCQVTIYVCGDLGFVLLLVGSCQDSLFSLCLV